ncbi:E3 ubiquitin-protein ligase RNFT1 isoform X3 [Dunckerocampus dactyliophorus]|uniref:E3 ubiquitin-protein ligase RNFT1 isoform X3 n=1 Tax=Dunckerocampus dactyliophorus TaxID=161453 RepID=UPI002405343B|nr:E3 ubiquitin-protein ligase RNFT1 isoform X3 [Dunckerocampus dactyliophorus]
MKLRLQNDRSDSRGAVKVRESPAVMQPNSRQEGTHARNGLSLTLQTDLPTRTAAASAAAAGQPKSNEVRVPMTGGPGESGGGASTRRSRVNSHSHTHSHGHGHHCGQRHSNSEPELDQSDSDPDSGEPSASLSELRCLVRWLQKSLPFLVILSAKLVIQHALGLAVAVGLFTTFLYVNKNIQMQVFLQDRHAKLQCVWLLVLLISSTLLLYYTFLTETLYNCLVFLSPTMEPLGFWEILWAVGITNFIIKFFFMGIKCLIVLVPASLASYRTQGRWLLMTEELGQVYQAVAPVPLWFRYLVTYQEMDGAPALTVGVLLALLYLILKLLRLYGQWTSLLKTVRMFLMNEQPEVTSVVLSYLSIRGQRPQGVSAWRLEMCVPSVRENTSSLKCSSASTYSVMNASLCGSTGRRAALFVGL